MRVGFAALLASTLVATAGALDEVVLKNGRRYLGTIVSSTPDTIVLSIDGGTVEFPRSIVASPPYLGTATPDSGTPKDATAAPPDEPAANRLPGVTDALHKLHAFPWVTDLHQVPVLVTDQGRWQFLPCISFWVADFFQLSIYGDPGRPSAIEVSLQHPAPTAWEQKRHLLEYMLSLVPGLAVDNRFDGLDLNGDQFAIGDLWFEVTGPESDKTPGRWTILLLHELSLKDARASYEELRSISELLSDATIDPSRPRSWQHGSWLPAEIASLHQTADPAAVEAPATTDAPAPRTAFTALGGERVYLRAFERQRGKYTRTNNDWLRDFTAAPP